ncbi:MAG: MlaD family protein [Blastocatellia bacterium]|nr:MlaD family protein [Blastocatellia bacterium]
MAKKQVGLADLRVGLLVVVAMVALVAVILTISGDINPFRNQLIVKTRLASVDGLRSGAEVRLAGVKVGQVRQVKLLTEIPKDQSATSTVELELAIDPVIDGKPAGERIRKDSKVVLGSVGLLGDKVVDIIPGTLEKGPVANYEYIEGSQETTIRQLISGADDILANFTTLSSTIKEIADKVRSGKGTIGKLVTDEALYANLNKTVEESQKLVRDVREGKGTAGRLISDPQLYNEINSTLQRVEKLVADISDGKGTLGKLATDEQVYTELNNVLGRLDRTSAKLETIVDRVDRGEGNLGLLLKEDKLYRDAEQTVANLNKITARLEKGEGSAGRMLKDPELYENLNQAAAQTTKLVADFRQDPKKYLTIKLKLF